jgi:hypothetical protein
LIGSGAYLLTVGRIVPERTFRVATAMTFLVDAVGHIRINVADDLRPDPAVGAAVSGNAAGGTASLSFCVPGRSART